MADQRAALEKVILKSGMIEGVPNMMPFNMPGLDSERWFVFASEIVHGRPLRDYMPPARSNALKSKVITDVRAILAIVYRLADTLRELHACGLACSLFSPTAVFLEPGDRPVILSFGVIQRGGTSLQADLKSGWFSAYVPPNAKRGGAASQELCEAWDIYAIGVLLAQWLTATEGPVKASDFSADELSGLFVEMKALAFGRQPPLTRSLRRLVFDLLSAPDAKDPIIPTMDEAARRIHSLIEY
jgi:hypothetical protein